MATLKQKRVARKIVKALEEDSPITGGEIVESSGYGVSMKKNPQVVLNSIGVTEELHKFGISIDKADSVVGYILEYGEREESQLNAADKVYKRLGGYAPEKSINLNVETKPSERALKLADELLHKQRNS